MIKCALSRNSVVAYSNETMGICSSARLQSYSRVGWFVQTKYWPGAMSVLVSGGGWRMGQVIGQTNDKGEHPIERTLDPNDFVATVYRFLGINPESMILDHRGRPMPLLPTGRPIQELI